MAERQDTMVWLTTMLVVGLSHSTGKHLWLLVICAFHDMHTNSCEFKCRSFNGMENCPKVWGGRHCWGQETRRGKTLTVYDELLIIQSVLDNPSIYLHELQRWVEEASTSVTESAICGFLHRQNFSHKKLTKIASPQSEELREKFLIDCSAYEPEMLVFVDETGCNRHSAMRRFGYSLRGLLNCMC